MLPYSTDYCRLSSSPTPSADHGCNRCVKFTHSLHQQFHTRILGERRSQYWSKNIKVEKVTRRQYKPACTERLLKFGHVVQSLSIPYPTGKVTSFTKPYTLIQRLSRLSDHCEHCVYVLQTGRSEEIHMATSTQLKPRKVQCWSCPCPMR